MDNKVFVWYDSDSGYGRGGIMYGPYCYPDIVKFGKKLYHTLEEMLEMDGLSDAIKKRLSGAKMGTAIKIQYLHSSGNLMVKRVNKSEIKLLDIIDKNNKELDLINKKSRELNEENNKLSNKLNLKK